MTITGVAASWFDFREARCKDNDAIGVLSNTDLILLENPRMYFSFAR